jgi:predicted HicB family RNase H-like nuclease
VKITAKKVPTFLHIRISPKEHEQLKRKAKRNFKSLSQFVRDVLRAAA